MYHNCSEGEDWNGVAFFQSRAGSVNGAILEVEKVGEGRERNVERTWTIKERIKKILNAQWQN